jgi:DNA polymerase III sliding clamp (beta) subunit (PCNA family)
MHITCRRRDLYRALRLLSHAIPTRSTLPILQNVLIEAHDAGRLRLAATNLEMGIACSIEAAVEQEGSAAVPTLPLLAFLRGHTDEERVKLITEDAPPVEGRSMAFLLVDDLVVLPCADAERFPCVKGPTEVALTIRCPARLLSEIIVQVAFAAASNIGDSILSNVWLQLEGAIATFATSNGSRCALRTVSGTGSTGRGELLLVTARPLASIGRLLPRQGEAQMEVARHKGLLCIRSDGLEFLVRLTDPHVRPFAGEDLVAQYTQHGKSSPFEQYIPQSSKTIVVLSKKDLQAALSKKAWPLSCSLQGDGEKGCLVLKIYGKEEVTTHAIPAQWWGTPFPTVWVNMRFLADALSCPGATDSLVLGFGSAHTDAILLRWLDQEGGVRQSYSYVIMPLNPLGVLQHKHVHRALSVLPLLLPVQGFGRTESARENKVVAHLREETMSLLMSMLVLGIVPTEAEIQESVLRLKQLAARPARLLLETCRKHGSEVVQMLAVAAFAESGCVLELASRQLAFDAKQMRTALADVNGSCL